MTTVPSALVCLFVCLLLFCPSTLASRGFLAIFQDDSGQAYLQLLDEDTGDVKTTSSFNWTFPFPLVETTSDSLQKKILIITYPTGSNATLFTFNDDLQLIAERVSSGAMYFDLQFSPAQKTLYGIYVSSRYGRVLSKFDIVARSDPVVSQIQALPYGWYVNASTLLPTKSIYYGLLNYFPTLPNPTLEQKLAVGKFGKHPRRTTFVNLGGNPACTNESVVHFICTLGESGLVGLAQTPSGVRAVSIDESTGYCDGDSVVPGFETGPIFCSGGAMSAVLKDTAGHLVYAKFERNSNGHFDFRLIKTWKSSLRPAAVTYLNWDLP